MARIILNKSSDGSEEEMKMRVRVGNETVVVKAASVEEAMEEGKKEIEGRSERIHKFMSGEEVDTKPEEEVVEEKASVKKVTSTKKVSNTKE